VILAPFSKMLSILDSLNSFILILTVFIIIRSIDSSTVAGLKRCCFRILPSQVLEYSIVSACFYCAFNDEIK